MQHKLSIQNSCNTIYRRNMVCFLYVIVNSLHIGDKYNNNNNNNNKLPTLWSCNPYCPSHFSTCLLCTLAFWFGIRVWGRWHRVVTFLSTRKPPGWTTSTSYRMKPLLDFPPVFIRQHLGSCSYYVDRIRQAGFFFIRIICYILRLCFITKSYLKFGEMMLWHLCNWNWSMLFVIYFCFAKNVSVLVMRCKNGVTRCRLRPERNNYSATTLPNVTSYNFVQAANTRTHKMKTNAG